MKYRKSFVKWLTKWSIRREALHIAVQE